MLSQDWNDFRIAQQVAISGTLTGAGEVLGINHATVLRHINRLEASLDTKLFIRHQRGYKLTEAGQILAQQLPAISAQFNQLVDSIRSTEDGLSGDLIISTVSDFALQLNPLLKEFQQTYPNLRIQIIATDERVSLESGAAHVALRITEQVEEPDLIAHRLKEMSMQLAASHSYVDEYGLPRSHDEFKQHKWILPNGKKRNLTSIKEILPWVPSQQIIYQSNSFRDIQSAVIQGMGIGPVTMEHTDNAHELQSLELEIGNIKDSTMWFVYHRSLKNSQRIQVLLQFLKQHFH